MSLHTHSSSAQSFLEASLSINIPCTAHMAIRPGRENNNSLAIFLFWLFLLSSFNWKWKLTAVVPLFYVEARHLGECPPANGKVPTVPSSAFLTAPGIQGLICIWFSKETQTRCLFLFFINTQKIAQTVHHQ